MFELGTWEIIYLFLIFSSDLFHNLAQISCIRFPLINNNKEKTQPTTYILCNMLYVYCVLCQKLCVNGILKRCIFIFIKRYLSFVVAHENVYLFSIEIVLLTVTPIYLSKKTFETRFEFVFGF